jgi:hypothetical protein
MSYDDYKKSDKKRNAPKKQKEYLLLSAPSAKELTEEVNAAIKDGWWTDDGAVASGASGFCQALHRWVQQSSAE